MLQQAGLATVAYDYLGCGRSTKPNEYFAYSAQNIYQDMKAVYDRYSQVRLLQLALASMVFTRTVKLLRKHDWVASGAGKARYQGFTMPSVLNCGMH